MEHQEHLAIQLKSLNNQIRKVLEQTMVPEAEEGLTATQYAVLSFVAERSAVQDILQQDIEREFFIRSSTASELVRQLERCGYLMRLSVPGNARLKKIITTEKARQAAAPAIDQMERLQQQMTKGLTHQELEQFCRVLQRLSQNIGG